MKDGEQKNQTPDLPPRNDLYNQRSQSVHIGLFDPDSIVFEPYITSSSSESDNDSLSEEVVSVCIQSRAIIVDRY